MDYTNAKFIVDYLVSTDGSIVIPSSVLTGYAMLTRSLNPSGDLIPGNVNTATLDFIVLELSGPIKSYTGKKFRYIKGYAEGETIERSRYVCDHYLASGDGWIAYSRKKQLTVRTDTDMATYQLQKEPGCLVYRNGALTALYTEEPFAESYQVDGVTLTGPTVPVMTDYEKHIALAYARHGESYYCTSRTMSQFSVIYLGTVRSIASTSYELHDKGVFIANRPERGTGGQYTISCVDHMSLFDADRMDVLNTITESTTAGTLLQTLCNYANVPLAEQTRLNSGFKIAAPADVEAITGTEMLTWLGEIMGCSWRINVAGELESRWYKATAMQFGMADYQSFSYGTYEVAPIDKVIANSTRAEVFGSAGSGNNALTISDNGFIPATSKEELDAFCATLLPAVSGLPVYVSGSVNGYANPTIYPGDIIQVENEDNEYETFCIVQTSENGFLETYEAAGNEKREVQNVSTLSNTSLKGSIQETTEYPQDWKADILAESNRITGVAGGQYKLIFSDAKPAGFYILQDSAVSAEARKLWRFDAQGLGWLESGVDGPVSRTLITADGHLGATALSGTIIAGQSSWDLDSDRAVFKQVTVGSNDADLSTARFQDIVVNGTTYTVLVKGG